VCFCLSTRTGMFCVGCRPRDSTVGNRSTKHARHCVRDQRIPRCWGKLERVGEKLEGNRPLRRETSGYRSCPDTGEIAPLSLDS
jgi:hypothetical protein